MSFVFPPAPTEHYPYTGPYIVPDCYSAYGYYWHAQPWGNVYAQPDWCQMPYPVPEAASLDTKPHAPDETDSTVHAWYTALCSDYRRGHCPREPHCKFIHDPALLHIEEDNRLAQPGYAKPCFEYIRSEGKKCPILRCRYSHPRNPTPFMKYTPCNIKSVHDTKTCRFKH